ncbi:MAG: DUF3098 domain-containing protein [Balneolaceae bacterium]
MTAKRRRNNKETKPMFFTPLNYKLMGLGLLLIIIGFTAMRLENEVYGFVSLYVSPIVIMGGYITIIFAVLKRDHKVDESSPEASS